MDWTQLVDAVMTWGSQEMTTATTMLSKTMMMFRTNPAGAWSVVFGWLAVLSIPFRIGMKIDTYFQEVEDGQRSWF